MAKVGQSLAHVPLYVLGMSDISGRAPEHHASPFRMTDGEPICQYGEEEAVHATSGEAVRVFMLGQFVVQVRTRRGFVAARWGHGQARMLLKCLLSASAYQLSRDQIIDRLWPDQDIVQGRESLRHALSRLRRVLEPTLLPYADSQVLMCDRESVGLRVISTADVRGIWLDGARFEHLALAALNALQHRSCAEACEDGNRFGDAALALYRGLFLPADTGIDWTQTVRARFQRLQATLLRQLVSAAIDNMQWERALLLQAHLVDAIPDDEDDVCRLMTLQAMTGHRADALRAFASLKSLLRGTYDMEPGADVAALARAIQAGDSLERWQESLRRG